MKKNIKLYLCILVIIIETCLLIKPWNIFKEEKIEEKIAQYYDTVDFTHDIDKYNSLVTPEYKKDNIDNIAFEIEDSEILMIKELIPTDYKYLMDKLENEFKDIDSADIKFYFVLNNVKVKEDQATSIESGIYGQVIPFQKINNEWKIVDNCYKAYIDKDGISVGY